MMEFWCSSYPSDILQMAEDGIIMPLNDLLDQYGQNILEVFPEEQYVKDEDGNIWNIPTRNCEIGTDALFIIREDWLKNVGKETPNTLDELYDVLVAFRDQDANGNGDPTDEIPWGYAASGVGTVNPLDIIVSALPTIRIATMTTLVIRETAGWNFGVQRIMEKHGTRRRKMRIHIKCGVPTAVVQLCAKRA